jgi:hypothetical protein
MEAMLGISLYSYLSQASENFVFLIIVYVFSSRKLEKMAEQVLPGSKAGREEVGDREEKWSKQYMHK